MKHALLSQKLIPKKFIERTLSQIDKIGFELARSGLTHKFNRHTVIAAAIVQKQKIEGEIDRAQLRYQLKKNEITKLTAHLDSGVDKSIQKLPDALAKPATRIHKRLRSER